jgi:hypothetical protein
VGQICALLPQKSTGRGTLLTAVISGVKKGSTPQKGAFKHGFDPGQHRRVATGPGCIYIMFAALPPFLLWRPPSAAVSPEIITKNRQSHHGLQYQSLQPLGGPLRWLGIYGLRLRAGSSRVRICSSDLLYAATTESLTPKTRCRSTIGQPSFYKSLHLAAQGEPGYGRTTNLLGAINGNKLPWLTYLPLRSIIDHSFHRPQLRWCRIWRAV